MSLQPTTVTVTQDHRGRLASDTGWNIIGQVLPLLVGILTVPALIRALGMERFGFITIIWVLIGYAGVFDFGIGRALIRSVAARLSRGDQRGAEQISSVGMGFLAIFGVLVGAAFVAGSNWIVRTGLHMPQELQAEAHTALLLLALSIPFVMVTNGYVGILSAYRQFKGMNLVKASLGIVTYIGPLLVAMWHNRLDWVVAMVVAMRVIATLAHLVLCQRLCGFSALPRYPDRAAAAELFALGGWISVSNLIGPLMSYLDRILLSGLVPIRMVPFYSTPFDLISKTMILPYSLMGAIFPIATGLGPGTDASRRLLSESVRLLYLLMFPLLFVFFALARPGLRLWLGDEFADRGTAVLQLLAVGTFLNALAQGPAMLIQSAGKPSWMAKLHLIELPIFVGVLVLLTAQLGIVGAALASALRSGLDALAVFVLARCGVAHGPMRMKPAVMPGLLAIVMFTLAAWPVADVMSVAICLGGLLTIIVFSWVVILQPSERLRLRNLTFGAST